MMRKLKIAALGLAATLLLSGCGFHGLYGAQWLPGGANLGGNPYTVTIYFGDVLDLVPQSAVKVNDVPVGRVESVSLSTKNDDSGAPSLNGWIAKVKVKVNGDVQLPSNARAAIEQTSLLGEKYVALEEPLSAPASTTLRSDPVIRYTSTTTAPDVEQVLGALSLLLNGGGLNQIHVITTELNKALNGNEGAIRDLLAQLNEFLGQLDQQKSYITGALDSLDRLSTTLADQKATLAATLDSLPKALGILAEDRSKFTTLLTSLSHLGAVASDVISQTQTSLTSALKDLSPALEQLAAAGSDLPHALQVAGTFPFPLGKTLDAVKGDYANLHLLLNLNLTDELCGVSTVTCLTSTNSTSGSSSTQETATTDTATSVQQADTTVYQPTLLGVSG